MAGAQNGIVGDDFPTDLPETQVSDYDISREQSMARFSKSKEFQVLKKVMEKKMDFWRQYIPGPQGTAISIQDLSNSERGWRWLAADQIISEFQSVLAAYEQAESVVKDATSRRKGA